MAKSVLQLALESLRETCDQEFEIRSYSGRAMYGKTCVAIVGDDLNMFKFGLALGAQADEDTMPIDDLLYEAENMKQDSMGLGTVYYWPRVPFVGEEDAEEE